jgi:hypothetical protein
MLQTVLDLLRRSRELCKYVRTFKLASIILLVLASSRSPTEAINLVGFAKKCTPRLLTSMASMSLPPLKITTCCSELTEEVLCIYCRTAFGAQHMSELNHSKNLHIDIIMEQTFALLPLILLLPSIMSLSFANLLGTHSTTTYYMYFMIVPYRTVRRMHFARPNTLSPRSFLFSRGVATVYCYQHTVVSFCQKIENRTQQH